MKVLRLASLVLALFQLAQSLRLMRVTVGPSTAGGGVCDIIRNSQPKCKLYDGNAFRLVLA